MLICLRLTFVIEPKPKEVTVLLVKPDAVEAAHTDEIVEKVIILLTTEIRREVNLIVIFSSSDSDTYFLSSIRN